MSSHREAPEISQDPVADSTDVYAFVSPDRPDTVTLIANYIPLEDPAGGPNFFEFGEDVLYRINIDNNGDGSPDIAYEFRFRTEVSNPNTFLYNTGPIDSLASPNWNRKQFYDVTRISFSGSYQNCRERRRQVVGSHLASPPCNIGPRSTGNYAALADAAVHNLGGGRTVFAGQRLDGFYVDLGSIFDLGDLRPFQNLHLIPTAAAEGVDALRSFSVHSIAIQVPISDLTSNGRRPTDPMKPESVIGVWTTASRQKAEIRAPFGDLKVGPWVQVSRLGNPLFNEVIVPMSKKDVWNKLEPWADRNFVQYVKQPELAKLIPVLYPGVFPKLGALTADRADLVAILLTGLPAGIVPGFQNFTGTTYADELRLNVAIPPSRNPNILGIIGGDLAGFPNGRRVSDDVVTIEIRAIAGATYPLVASYTPDAAATAVTDGVTPPGNVSYRSTFPVSRPAEERLRRPAVVGMTAIRAGHAHGPDSHQHTHAPDRDHPQAHVPATGPEGPPRGGPVVFDIGGDVGALVARMDERLWGEELFLAPDSDPHTTTHTGIWTRHMAGQDVVVAIFPSLVEGRYAVLDEEGDVRTRVVIRGGEVGELDLRVEEWDVSRPAPDRSRPGSSRVAPSEPSTD